MSRKSRFANSAATTYPSPRSSGGGGGSGNATELQTTPISSGLPGQVAVGFSLVWNGTDWVASATNATKIQTMPIDPSLPAGITVGDVLTWNGTVWAAEVAGGSGNATSLQGTAIISTLSTGLSAGDLLTWNGSDWVAAPPGGFAITGFSMGGGFGGVVEVGTTIVNPSIAASYNELPASASVATTNPVTSTTLSTPFTAGTAVGSFPNTSNAVDGTTAAATLSATQGTTVTRTVTTTWAGAIVAGSTTNLTPGQTLYDALTAQQKHVNLGRAGAWAFTSTLGQSQVFGFLTSRGTPAFKDTTTGLPYTFVTLGAASITENGTTQAVTFYSVAATGFNGGITTS
jgi:hypothetical protein